MSGKNRVPRKPDPPKTAKTSSSKDDPSPYLAKYRPRKQATKDTKAPKPMIQTKITQNGTLEFLPKPALNPTYRIPKKIKPKVVKKNPIFLSDDDIMENPYESSDLIQVINLDNWTSSSDSNATTTSKQLNDLNDLMKDISGMESEMSNCRHISKLDDIISEGSKITKYTKKMLEYKMIKEEEKQSTLVNVDVFELIAKMLNQFNRDLGFTDEFTYYKSYLSGSVKEITIIKEPICRLQVQFARLLINYIDNDSPEAEVDQVSLLSDLVSSASKITFSPYDLFPAFYFAVQHLIDVYTNWKDLPWMSEERPDFTEDLNEDEDLEMRESQAEVLRRNLDNIWCSILTATLQLLQRSKVPSTSSPSLYGCSIGTAFLLVILVAKCWYSVLFFNRITPKLDDATNTAKSYNIVSQLGRTICALYDGEVDVSPLKEVLPLFYPFLLYKQGEDGLLLSNYEANSLLNQLMDMNNPKIEKGSGNQLQCAFFQIAFTVVQHRLVWKALKDHNVKFTTDFARSYLMPYQSLDVIITSWRDIYNMMLNAEEIPFTEKEDNQQSKEMFWFGQRTAVLELLQTLSTVARKYIITEKFANKPTSIAEFRELRLVVNFFSKYIKLDGITEVGAVLQMLDWKK